MTVNLAVRDLRTATTRLAEAVAELVTIAHEDRPAGSQPAVVDHVAEQVSELQGAVVDATRELAAIERPSPSQVVDRMPAVEEALARAALCYWRDLRSYDAAGSLRRAARRDGADWRAWQASVAVSEQRCEQPLLAATAAARAVWLELAELVGLWLAHPPPVAVPTPTPRPDPAAPHPWRTS